jgi:gentisate 1,2-dioxygenase
MISEAAIDFSQAGNMRELYALLAKAGMENGWDKPEPSMWPQPKKHFVPAHWSYANAKSALDAAGRFVNTELAERRNLILANPIPGNHYPTVRTLVSAYQMVKAHETARSHRHTANALRLVLDADPHAYTIVDGKKIPMEPGDVLLTPNWAWHAHANESRSPAYWLDFLDLPLVHLLGPMFFEHHPDQIEKSDTVAADSPARFSWADIRARLADQAEAAPGRREIELGSPALPTIALHVLRLDAAAEFCFAPTTANSIFAVMQGGGSVSVDDRVFEWGRGDIVAVPTGCAHAWRPATQSHLLRVTDEPLFRGLGWMRPVPAATA